MTQESTVRKFTCVSCPVGCDLVVTMQGDEVVEVTGHTCPRGVVYATNEATNPKRVLTMLVDVKGSVLPASCRSTEAIPKKLIPDCIEVLRKVVLNAPVEIGQVIVPNICDTGVDIIATKAISA